MTTAFFGVPLSAKAAEEDNTEYTIDVTADGDFMVSTSSGGSVPMSNNGVLLWPGQKVISTSSSFVEPNTMVRCHHGSDCPDPYIHNQYVGFTITSAQDAVSLGDLGVLDSGEAEIVTGGIMTPGTEQTNITMGTMAYDKSFVANKLVFVEYGKTNISQHYTLCGCEANTPWDVYNYHQMSFILQAY